ncbi:MAG: N-acetyltransferase [Candidatus Omnitrophica bacterium]|nr:N-acetyltransferase [Candidatus Omnitrophota bacterium]
MIRKARLEDAKEIQKLINHFAKEELLLPRSLADLYESIRDFWVYRLNARIAGCCALAITWQDLAEVRSFAVEKRYQKRKIGRQLLTAVLGEAKELGIKSVFTLTYIPEYFKKFGFRRINKERLPQKVWVDCINCPRFPDCKEIAMIKRLNLP